MDENAPAAKDGWRISDNQSKTGSIVGVGDNVGVLVGLGVGVCVIVGVSDGFKVFDGIGVSDTISVAVW